MEYNGANQMLTEINSGGKLSALSVSNIFDNNLRRTSVEIKNGSTVLQGAGYAYDSVGRLQTVTDNSATAYTVAYAYETNSPLVSSITAKSNTTVRLTTLKQYDKLNRLLSISSTNSALLSPISFSYENNSANQRTKMTHEDGSYWIYEYDSLGQVKSGKKYWADGTPVDGQQFEYAHDDIGNRTSTGGRASSQSTYTPNRLNQYTSRTVPNKVDIMGIANPTANVTVGGNVANRKGEYFHYALTVYNTTNTYPAITNTSQYGSCETNCGKMYVPGSTESYTYDSDGNLTADGRWTYSWDGENRLVQMIRDTNSPAGAQQKLVFEYDEKGRRIRKQCYTNSGSYVLASDTCYIYDAWNMLGELDANTSNTKLRTYVWGLDLSGSQQGAGGVGGLLKVTDSTIGTTHHFTAYDGNGNVVGLIDATNGIMTACYAYGPFGEPLRNTGAMGKRNGFRFSSKRSDDESGMLYYGYRSYSPSVGRWMSRDPKPDVQNGGLAGLMFPIDHAPSSEVYQFARNSPVETIDELGLCSCPCGPDVSYLVTENVKDISDAYQALPKKRDRRAACGNILLSIFSSSNWEVDWLLHLPQQYKSCQGCQDTVVYNGNCMQRYALWYFLYGEAAKLCNAEFAGYYNDPIETLRGGLSLRQPFSGDSDKQIRDKVEVARHFYSGTPLSNQENQCEVDSTVPVMSNPDIHDWHWKGVR